MSRAAAILLLAVLLPIVAPAPANTLPLTPPPDPPAATLTLHPPGTRGADATRADAIDGAAEKSGRQPKRAAVKMAAVKRPAFERAAFDGAAVRRTAVAAGPIEAAGAGTREDADADADTAAAAAAAADKDEGMGVRVGAEVEPDGGAIGSGLWLWPTAGPRVIHRGYSAPATRYASGHRGIDLAIAGPVLAPADGVVHFAGIVVDRPVLSIMHEGGYLSSYEPVTTVLHKGDVVSRGEAIGEVSDADQIDQNATIGDRAPPVRATTGHCARSCLHFGLRLNGEYLSPLVLLGAIPRSVLLPTRRLHD
jgi:murein DD-endopeptidase MepM/ murein hydrolase activator NlpD